MGRQRKRTIKFSVYVEEKIFDKLMFEARKDGRPLSQWVAHMLTVYVDRMNAPAPEERVGNVS